MEKSVLKRLKLEFTGQLEYGVPTFNLTDEDGKNVLEGLSITKMTYEAQGGELPKLKLECEAFGIDAKLDVNELEINGNAA